MKTIFSTVMFALIAGSILLATEAFAGQGAQRMLYTVPNSGFIESPAGDSGVVTISDTSGSVATLQALINNTRSANPNSIVITKLLSGATYWVNNNSGGLVLGSQECLVGSGATIEATNSSVTNTLVLISSGATNVSVAGGTLNASGADIYGIFAPASAARVNIDKVTVQNCGEDCIQLNGNGGGTFDDEMTVTRCDLSGSPNHSGISIWNATQTTCVDNNCHNNSVGIWLANCAYCNIANNTCISNSTGVNCNSGSDNYVVNNTCDNNGTGVYAGGSGNMIVSDWFASNSVAAVSSAGSGNIYCDNLFTNGNAANFLSNGSGDDVVAYQGVISAANENYFYPPLASNPHTTTIINGKGRYDLTDNSTGPIDNVQSEYNAAVSANPGDVIVLHLNGSYTVGSNPLTLSSDTCILLGGKIQMSSSSTSEAIYASGASYVSISGGTIDGGTTTSSGAGHDAIYFTGCSMFQIDGMLLQNFGTSGTRVGGSDVVRIDHGSTPRIFTRNTISNGSARGFWLATSGVRDIVSDNTVTGVQMDGVDCDESTTASVIKNNYLADNTRYGVFLEQSASYNLVLGNVCDYDASFAIGCYNNSATPRGATAYNSVICNALLGDNGLRNGSTGDGSSVTSSDNFFFDNTVMSANIQSQLYGAQNYYSQNYMGSSSLSTSGTEVFFNPPDVSGNLYVQDSHSGLEAVVTNASTTEDAAVILGLTNALGGDQWSLIPTDGGYYQLVNKNSGLDLNVSNASTNAGALVIQWPFGSNQNDQWMPMSAGNGLYYLINRHSGLTLDVPGGTAGTQLDQQAYTGLASQQFRLIDATTAVTFSIVTNQIPTDYWLGGVASGNWNNGANWLSRNAPAPFDSLAFTNQSGASDTASNDFPAGTVFEGISFASSAAGSAFNLTGNSIVLSGATNGATLGITNATALAETVSNNLALDWGDYTFYSPAGSLSLNGALTASTGGIANFGGSNIKSTSLTTDAGGLISTLEGAGLVGNTGVGGGFTGLAAVSGGTISAYSYPSGSQYGNVTLPAFTTSSTITNIELTATAAGNVVLNSTANQYINTVFVTNNTANRVVLASASSGTLVLGNGNGVGGIYLLSAANTGQGLTIGGGSACTLTAGTTSSGGTVIFGINGTTTSNQAENNCTIADNGSGPVRVVKTGTGSMYFNLANTYSGGTYVDQGYLQINNSTGLGTGPVYVAGGAEIYLQTSGGSYANNFYISPGIGDSYSQLGAIKIGNGSSTCTISGALNVLGAPVAGAPGDMIAGSGSGGSVQLTGQVTGSGTLEVDAVAGNGNFINFYFGNTTASANNWTGGLLINPDVSTNGSIYVKDSSSNQLSSNNVTMCVNGTGTTRLDLNGSHADVIGGLNSGPPGNGFIQVDNAESGTSTLTMGANNASGSFGGTIQQDGGTLNIIKIGTGTQTLNGVNPYTGTTAVNGGTLALSGSGSIANSSTITVAAGAMLDASGRPDQTLTLSSGQTLQGSGTVNVNLTVGTGAKVMPGNSTNVGALTISSAAQLQGTTYLKLNATAGTCDQINASSVIYGGMLTVTNLSGALTAGQGFQLFLGSYAGAFSVTSLPPLGAGLAWSNSLAASGLIQVISTSKPQPHFTSVALSGTNLILGGTNGVNGETYVLLGSTNLAAPLSQWLPLVTNTFNAGNFNVTNPVNPAAPQNFYLLQLP